MIQGERPPGVKGILAWLFEVVAWVISVVYGVVMVSFAFAVWVLLLVVVPFFGIVTLLMGDALLGVGALAFAVPLWLVSLPLFRGLRYRSAIDPADRAQWWRALPRAWAMSAMFVVLAAVGILLAMFVLMLIMENFISLPGEQLMMLSLIAASLGCSVKLVYQMAR